MVTLSPFHVDHEPPRGVKNSIVYRHISHESSSAHMCSLQAIDIIIAIVLTILAAVHATEHDIDIAQRLPPQTTFLSLWHKRSVTTAVSEFTAIHYRPSTGTDAVFSYTSS